MRIVLLRHAECLGNVDPRAYCRIPDHALPLTQRGEEQARAVGPMMRSLLEPGPVTVYVSPYLRTRKTLELLALGDRVERTVAEPRLREQDWGNLQDPLEQDIVRRERNAFGHFFFRLPHGESGADVDDRVAAFLSELASCSPEEHLRTTLPGSGSPKATLPGSGSPKATLIISHGLTIRLLCRRLFSWSVDLFESLSNPDPCEYRVLQREGNRWSLDRPFDQWRDSPDGSVQNGDAHDSK